MNLRFKLWLFSMKRRSGFKFPHSSMILLLLLISLGPTRAQAEKISVAVASNFVSTVKEIARQFESTSGYSIEVVNASTGKLYAQIRHGAPYDIFFAADVERPAILEQENIGVANSRVTYALGTLALWSPDQNRVTGEETLFQSEELRHIAIANPKHAPYGRAAQQLLQAKGVWADFSDKLVRGENIGQTYQFVDSGNAELGFVAYSQIVSRDTSDKGSYWRVPHSDHDPIAQQALLLNESKVAREFLDFVLSTEGRTIIRQHGYELP